MWGRMQKLVRSLAKKKGVSLLQMMTTYKDDVEFAIHHEYVQYLEHAAEEMSVLNGLLGHTQLRILLCCFFNLVEFKIVNGRFSLTNHQINKEAPCEWNERLWVPAPSGTELRARGEGLWHYDLFSGSLVNYALWTSVVLLAQGFEKLRDLEINHLPWQCFHGGSYLHNLLKLYPEPWALTRLCLTVTFHIEAAFNNTRLCREVMRHGVLRNFIAKFSKLVDLSVSIPVGVNSQFHRAAELSDVLPPTITKLQKLRLDYFQTSENFFTNLLCANAPTLQVLDLHDILLNPHGSWVRIMHALRHSQKQLTSAKFSGEIYDFMDYEQVLLHNKIHVSALQHGWDFDDSPTLALRLERYLIHGGRCPLEYEPEQDVKLDTTDPNHPRLVKPLAWRRSSESEMVGGSGRVDPRVKMNAMPRRSSASL